MPAGVRLSPEQIAKVADSLAQSPAWRAAANHAGINESTIYDYRRRAESYTNRSHDLQDETDPDYPYYLAVQTWTEARSRLELSLVRGILAAIPKDWKAAHALLKSGWPADYSDRIELTGAGGGPVLIEQMKSEALERAELAIEQLGLRAGSDESVLASPAGDDEPNA